MNRPTDLTDKPDPGAFPSPCRKIPEPDSSGHRSRQDGPGRPSPRWAACVRFSPPSASLYVTPMSGGRFHVEGRVRARIGQTCVVTLDPIENDIDEAHRPDLRASGAIPKWPSLVEEAAESDVEIPDPPEPIENGVIDLGRIATDALYLRRRSLSAQAGCGVRAAGGG